MNMAMLDLTREQLRGNTWLGCLEMRHTVNSFVSIRKCLEDLHNLRRVDSILLDLHRSPQCLGCGALGGTEGLAHNARQGDPVSGPHLQRKGPPQHQLRPQQTNYCAPLTRKRHKTHVPHGPVGNDARHASCGEEPVTVQGRFWTLAHIHPSMIVAMDHMASSCASFCVASSRIHGSTV